MENRIVAIIPFHNASPFIKECYASLRSQHYRNYTLLFCDDCSDDGSADLLPQQEDILLIQQQERSYALKNIYDALSAFDFEEDDILAFVDGDDFLPHPEVFATMNDIYQQTSCLLTYGQYNTDTGLPGHCLPYTRAEFENLRKNDWVASHLKSFKYKLYRAFLEQDPTAKAYKDEKGTFYSMAYDVALMYPLMEIAGYEHVYFNERIVYTYRIHAQNEMNINRPLQIETEKQIRSRQPFERVFK
jgi:glycosyltransferase involved in cell wall biosynthesis